MKKFLGSIVTIVATMAMSSIAFAQDAAAAGANDYKLFIPLGVAGTLGLAAFGSAFGQGRAAAAALEGIGRNPAAAGKIQTPMILALVFMEALTLFSFIVAFLMSGNL